MESKKNKTKRVKSRKTLKAEYIKNKCNETPYSFKCNDIELKKEEIETKDLTNRPELFSELYPTLNDPNFSVKIADKKEFNDTQYDGEIFEDVKEHSNELISAGFRSLQPHQSFVKNFLSFQTPFNSLLLFHGLGSGKTCSAIGVCEESRDYLKQTGLNKKMIIVAAPNVLDNFRKELFDETKLVEKSGLWSISSCTGNKLLEEINPTNIRGLTKDHIILQIKQLIRTYYVFMGYIEFANYIEKIAGPEINLRRIRDEFNDRLLVIDEIHNIRVSVDDSKNKLVADNLLLLISNAERMRLLLLSATPMFNSCTEIIWLLNLLNINDRRPIIKLKKVFNSDSNLTEIGEELLVRKMRGYISYVRGENPYTFPFRIFPKDIDSATAYLSKISLQMNGRKIKTPTTLDLYAHPIGEQQLKGYAMIMDALKQAKVVIQTDAGDREMPHFSELDTINYTMIQVPLQALNIVYPAGSMVEVNLLEFYRKSSSSSSSSSSSMVLDEVLDVDEEEESTQSSSSSIAKAKTQSGGSPGDMTGTDGLKSVVSTIEGKYKYHTKTAHFFAHDNIGKYSSKIKKISDHILKSTGIVLVYSQYIDGGIIPMALALEELGFKHFNGALFDPPLKKKGTSLGTYAMITGSTLNSKEIVRELTDIKNKEGENIKVILISKSGSEGIDLKYIRQIHIMEPWYNMSRIEQIIGRGVRNGSHKDLPFESRNVEIYMHSTIIPSAPELEPADEYLYRLSEIKAKKIGVITQLMKKNAVDCILNQEQLNFTEDNFPNTIRLELSSGGIIENYQVGDKDYTSQCDYDKCMESPEIEPDALRLETYNLKFASEGTAYVMESVRSIMLDRHFYTAETFMTELSRMGKYSIEQIYVAVSKMIDDKTPIYDKYKRQGTLVNVDNYYLFQPAEITNKNITVFERMVPVANKPAAVAIKMDEDIVPEKRGVNVVVEENVLLQMREKYDAIIEAMKEKAVRGEKDFNTICGSAIYILIRTLELIPAEDIIALLVEYIVDYSSFENILDLLNYYSHLPEDMAIDSATFDGKVHDILNGMWITVGRSKTPSVCLYEKNSLKIAQLNRETKAWESVSDAHTVEECTSVLRKKYEGIRLNDIIGFIDYDADGYVFKTKETGKTRNSGAKCVNAGKTKTVKQINLVIGGTTLTPENTKDISQSILCIMQEFLMKYYNKVRPDRKWFLLRHEDKIING